MKDLAMNRRRFSRSALGGAMAIVGGCRRDVAPEDNSPTRRPVFVRRVPDYGAGLGEAMLQGLGRFPGLKIRGKSVLLKINLVETSPDRAINTDPRFVVAAAGAFRDLGASSVTVADGPGHHRDIDELLYRSGLGDLLDKAGIRPMDLNHQPVIQVRNTRGATDLPTLYLPRPVMESDLVVSLPKLKTHHWAGVTLSLKNLFGVMPGSVYGWPKNVFHWKEIDRSVADISRAVPAHFAIVDGIVGMEGDGPLGGSDVTSGHLLMGDDLGAVDAAACRLMGVDPMTIPHLRRVLGARPPTEVAWLLAAAERSVTTDRPFRMPPNWSPAGRDTGASAQHTHGTS